MIRIVAVAGVFLFFWNITSSSAPFGSVPIEPPKTEPAARGGSAEKGKTTTPRVYLEPVHARQESETRHQTAGSHSSHEMHGGSGSSRSAAGSGTGHPAQNVSSTLSSSGEKKWVQDERGIRYQVSKDALLPPGWKEIPPPSTPPQQAPATGFGQQQAPPQTYTNPSPPPQTYSVPPTYPQPPQTYHSPATGQAPAGYYAAPSAPQTYTQSGYPYRQPPSSTAVPPGKKRLRHKSGYTVIVDKDTIPGPEFEEITTPAPAQPIYSPPPRVPQQNVVPPMPQQNTGAAAPQTYSGLPQPVPPPYQQQPAASQQSHAQPQTYHSQPQLPHVPPTWQQQLPYQPPMPQYPNPPQVQQGVPPYGTASGYAPQQPVPVVRSTPPGKKWVADQQGLRYLVDEDTIVGPGMREITEEELNRPMMMPQQPRGSAIGRFFQRFTGGR